MGSKAALLISKQRVNRLGFYPQPERGELAYSLAARAVGILFPDVSLRRACERLLGARELTLGGLVPNNGGLLLQRVPDVAGLDEQTLIDGSIFHIVAPFLESCERSSLRASIFEGKARGTRGYFRRRGSCGIRLRYCPQCVRVTLGLGAPVTWQVAANYPGVNCCAQHQCSLVLTDAVLEPKALHNPTDWIEADASSADTVVGADLDFASDVEWLYSNRSKRLPGFRSVGVAIKRRLINTPRYGTAHGRVRWTRVVSDLCDLMPQTVARVDPGLLHAIHDQIFRLDVRDPIPRYLIVARVAGISVAELLDDAENSGAKAISTTTAVDVPASRREAQARDRLIALSKNISTKGRKPILGIASTEAALIRRIDRHFYETVMPARNRSGRNSGFDWAAKDRRLWLAVRGTATQLDQIPRSAKELLTLSGISKYALEKAKGRLPLTKILVSFLTKSRREMDAGQMYFKFHHTSLLQSRESPHHAGS